MRGRGEGAGRDGRTTRRAALRPVLTASLAVAVAAAAALTGCASDGDQVGPRFVTPPLIRYSSVLWPVPLQLVDAEPGSRVRITASLTSARGTWTSAASYDVGGDGTIDLARDKPLFAPFTEPDSAGLFWSLRGPTLAGADLAQQWMHDTEPVTLTASEGDRVVARRTFRLEGLDGLLHVRTVYTHDLAPSEGVAPPHETHEDVPVGRYYDASSLERPTGPAVLMFDDPSPGASADFTAALLSQFGASVFVVPMTSADGIHLSTETDAGTISAILDWLDVLAGVDARHVFVYGTGASEQLAIWAANRYPTRLHGLFAGGGPAELLCLAGSSASPVFEGSVGVPCERSPGAGSTDAPPLARVAGPVVLACGRADRTFPPACAVQQELAGSRAPRAGDKLLVGSRAAHAVTVPPGLPIALPAPGDGSGADAQATEQARVAFWNAVGQLLLQAVLS
ncbi:acyl-CoA thioesterase/BAAT N-terminal domain-containing protein [Leifsonia sp. EB34]|uniref:acyl-CoA thioesterase/bile acid-CoA:amino acid N-acyltransferase family protein n=1 Tax=Leifsonia sp. EB34 TaxID=3156303 RepID=UPI0035133657